MKDQNRSDDKVIAVAMGDPDYDGYRQLKDLPPHRLAVIRRFFKDYKALENKSVVVKDFCPVHDARTVFFAALKRYRAKTNTSGR
jgi:inorganic pyrophosphatase